MANASTSIVRLAEWLASAIGDSAALFADFSTETLGVELPAAVLGTAGVQSALRGAETTATAVGAAGARLTTTAAGGNDVLILAAFLDLGASLGQYYGAVSNLTQQVQANVNAGTVPDPTERAAAQALAADLGKQVSDMVLAGAVIDQSPEIGLALRMLGLLDWRDVDAQAGNPISYPSIKQTLELNRLKTLIDNPLEHHRQTLQWGAAGFDPTDLFELYRDFFDEEAEIEIGVSGGEPFLRHGSLRISRNSTTSPPSLTLSFDADILASEETRRALDDFWGVGTSSTMVVTGQVSGSLTPVLTFSLQPASGTVTGELRGFFDRNPGAPPLDLLGGVGLLSLTAGNLTAGVGAKANWDGARATIEPLLFADLADAKLTIGTTDVDSFIGALLAGATVEADFDLGVELAPSEGIRLKASGGVEIALPIHKSIGPITFETLYLVLRIDSDGTLGLEVSAALLGQLGPLAATVDRLGAQLDLRFADKVDAEFGPFDVALAFKPPNGIGLSLDVAGIVKGGGYLYIDSAKGEYAGALELTFAGFLSLKAIGIVNTILPDGQPGFSLLLIITAEFSPGFQLGFGFVLSGVGGLLGLNRGASLDALSLGVRTGSTDSVLFPTNVIENAPQIISDLRAFFPTVEGLFLIGPMAKIGWGTPVLVSVSLGIIIEIPGNIVILGRLAANLPTEETALVLLQVSFIGALEIDKRRIWFFASLFESRVLFITIDGEMGLLMDYSDNPNFVLSVGGFHPRYTVPPLPFPTPKRISICLINESYARISAEGYFAVTSNSVQFGSHAEMFFGFDALSAEGYVTFDALIQLSPIYFTVDIAAGFSVKVFGMGVYGIHLRGSLEGPAPFRVQGSATIEFLFFDISVDVDVTFGDTNRDTLPPIAVMPLLQQEVEKPENWVAGLPPSGQLFTTLRDLGGTASQILHPVGTLTVSQRTVPLNLTIDTIGSQKTSDVNHVSFEVTAGSLAVSGVAKESFARAQYQELDDATKLSQPAFEQLDSGVTLASGTSEWKTGVAADRTVRYEVIYIDTLFERFQIKFFEWWGGLFLHFALGSSTARSSISLATQVQKQPFAQKVEVASDRYAVAYTSTNKAYAQTSTFASHAQAEQHMKSTLTAHPELADTIHVIPAFEVNAA
jgi:hypothetical protein